ncbi:hypothetical protein Micbo1qcDRAFT_175153 [Microdochium bolleyi]|uniref:RRM domain-containing protein n=1 Tax=Microdochium bolleyi TaxID=196109 RepID=A0A136J4M3_9PEZI|nr:hypothetical protein Micbo1qcDRAFT_175153 [Microdochium bolleyi]
MGYPNHIMGGDHPYGPKRSNNTSTPAHLGQGHLPPGYMVAHPGVMPDAASAAVHGQAHGDTAMNSLVSQIGGLSVNTAAPGQAPAMSGPYLQLPDGQIMYAPGLPHPAVPAFGYGQNADAHSNAFFNPYMQNGQTPFPMPYGLVPLTPGRPATIHERPEHGVKEVPPLSNRRSSYSTNESAPTTPFFGSVAARDQASRVAIFDRSAYTTPSPQQMISNAAVQHPKGFHAIPAVMDRDLEALLKKDPAVPSAVPAVFTPQENMKSLEQSLINHIPGNRNVYIRGLHPTTDDDLLYAFAERFGKVETSKAIIDTATGACKGFGFAKFCDVRDSEKCIRGFYRLGYEVGFARVRIIDPKQCYLHVSGLGANELLLAQESFNSRLKAEGDECSTNLYISNLPKSTTEIELGAIFLGYNILSSKILRDHLGNSRGVGFARFENRDVCEEIMHKFQGQRLGSTGNELSIRYADTPQQKELKRITAERRQFRTNEYNVGAYGTPLVGMNPTIYSQSTWKRGGSGLFANGQRSDSLSSSVDHTTSSGVKAPVSSSTSTNAAPSENGSDDEVVTIQLNGPAIADGTSRASPAKAEDE